MDNIEFHLNNTGNGFFEIKENNVRIAEMALTIKGDELTVFHTQVSEKAEGRGLAKQLLQKMVTYAREHNLKVIPLCPFVLAQFKRHPDEYNDVWKKESAGFSL